MFSIFSCVYLLSVYLLCEYLLRSLARCLIKLFVFSFLSFKSSLSISGNTSFLDMSFANIFFQSGLSSHYLESVVCIAENLNLN